MNIFDQTGVNEQGLRPTLKKSSIDPGRPVRSLSLAQSHTTKLVDF